MLKAYGNNVDNKVKIPQKIFEKGTTLRWCCKGNNNP